MTLNEVHSLWEREIEHLKRADLSDAFEKLSMGEFEALLWHSYDIEYGWSCVVPFQFSYHYLDVRPTIPEHIDTIIDFGAHWMCRRFCSMTSGI